MKIVTKQYSHFINDKLADIKIDLNNEIDYNLHIVYYINCLINPNYYDWLCNQIKIVEPFNGTIYIIATLNKHNETNFRHYCKINFNNCIVECSYENEYEYQGILKVWQLGQLHSKSNDIILYFHSKGLTHNQKYISNKNDNYNIILKDINRIKEIYTIFPTIDKIGFFSGGIGWIWYNFWYARGSYINKVEKPLKTTRRHYYEDWLSRKVNNDHDIHNNDNERPMSYYSNTLHSCYGIYTDNKIHGNIGSYYCPNTNKMFIC